ncbi:UDP-N-acetylmuramoyl-L-alanyl-D-glutamate--2,6-diaminopimelate ligase [Candidatus Sumerlaeota bacterium]|nr:UDP-N-acetylmuramoyl-L-alanyl-D-glutamate--2,6-diaminopimelate ligase [Candidatus Sumerlaeota bacterium]
MKLDQLLATLPEKEVSGTTDLDIRGVVYDPLRVKPGFLYVAINIYTQLDKIELPDGHEFVDKAIEAGATAVLLDHDMPVADGITKIVVSDSRRALALIAGEFHGHPSRKMKLIGVTGTNGKTTTAHVVEAILIERHRVGLIGTLYYRVAGEIRKSKDTTPEPPDLQEIFQDMVAANCSHLVMEVSSHGVDFHRVDGVDYEVGGWTNLTQDHLDYHGTMEAYMECKLRWVRTLAPDKTMVVNVDDPAVEHFREAANCHVLSYGIENPADVMAKDIELSGAGSKFTLVTPQGEIVINAKLRGQFNVYNMLCGAAMCLPLGVDLETIRAGLEKPIIVFGRFHPIERGQDFAVIIDYAHTPDGLVKVLDAARATNPRRLITVFGCGGDRDRSKRPKMAKVVDEKSDYFIITDDNPRTEDPNRIVTDILAGVSSDDGRCEVIHDRAKAIERAVNMAETGDMVVIAGKGHETTQTLKTTTLEFNDVHVADGFVAKRLGQA